MKYYWLKFAELLSRLFPRRITYGLARRLADLYVVFDRRGRECVMSGDLMHHAVQCPEPDWSSCFCVDPEHARRTRRAFLEQYADSAVVILPAHFPTPTAGRVQRSGLAWHFEFVGQ
jgi:glyoxylase-like metal-dependent hydrolase (beta-lactamase superfamily II)